MMAYDVLTGIVCIVAILVLDINGWTYGRKAKAGKESNRDIGNCVGNS